MTVEPVRRDLTEHEARALTDEIKRAAERIWSLLLEAHERHAWAALGYETWEGYVRAEFDMSRTHSYALLDQGRVVREIGAAAGDVSYASDISIRDARDLKPHLELVAQQVRERTAVAPPEQVPAIVQQVVEEERAKVAQRRADRQALDDLAEELDLPEVDEQAEDSRIEVTHGFYRALQSLAGLPPAAEVAALIPPYQQYRLADLPKAVAWLTDFADLWEART